MPLKGIVFILLVTVLITVVCHDEIYGYFQTLFQENTEEDEENHQ